MYLNLLPIFASLKQMKKRLPYQSIRVYMILIGRAMILDLNQKLIP